MVERAGVDPALFRGVAKIGDRGHIFGVVHGREVKVVAV